MDHWALYGRHWRHDEKDIQELHKQAYTVKLKNVGNKVYFRGIIEFSNNV